MSLSLDARRLAMLAEMGLDLVAPTAARRTVATSDATENVASTSLSISAEGQFDHEKQVVTALPSPVAALDWPALAEAVAACRACGLCQSRRQTVFGIGPARADWFVVGEAPGEQEDLRGEPFVGPAGQLLDNMLRAIGLARGQDVYIANVLKCRPPGNRNPTPEEVALCRPFLERQLALVQPRMVLAMGRFAVEALLGTQEPIGRLRGRVHRWQGLPVVVTYHPAYLLRTLTEKAKAWADLCLALETLERGAAPG